MLGAGIAMDSRFQLLNFSNAQRVRVGPALNGSFLNGTVWPGRQFQRSCVYSSFFFEGLRDERRNHLRRAHGEKKCFR